MRLVGRIVLGLLALVVVVLVGAVVWLLVSPPELLRVADGYAAKTVCSNVFLAGRDPEQVLGVDVQAAGNPVLKFIRVAVDKASGTVTARMAGVFAPGVAIYRPGLGCAAVPDGNVDAARKIALASQPEIAPLGDAPWPAGNNVGDPDSKIQALLADPNLTGPGMRAVVVVKDGRIVAETYGDGFGYDTPLIGWSLTKTVSAVLLGEVMEDGKLGFDDTALFPAWSDKRKDIKLSNMLAMESGLQFNEDYGDVTDVTRMLYLEPDMAGFASRQSAIAAPGTSFSYSTGIGMMLARLWMDRVGDEQAALGFPRQRLFGPLGMTSAVFEADEAGTLAGGSYVYASARDWARIGQLLLQDGVWNGQRLLPEGFVARMGTSNGVPGGYSQLQTWVQGPRESVDGKLVGLPADTFWLEGHDGQSVAVIPSAHMVIVRMGLTPWDLNYGPEPMDKAIVAAAAS